MNYYLFPYWIWVRHPITTRSWDFWRDLIRTPLLKFMLILYLMPILWGSPIKWPIPLTIYNFSLRSFLLNPSCISIIREVFMLSCGIADWQSSCNSSDTLVRKWLIWSLGLETEEGAYLDILTNSKEYSWTLFPPCQRLLNSVTFSSLISLGTNV